jgi:signal transduction histidine kinase
MHKRDSQRIPAAERRRQMNALRDKRREIFQRIHESRYNEQIEMRRHLHELEATMDALQGGKGHRSHRNPFTRNEDFKRYYAHVHRTRYIFFAVNLLLWGALFVLSGPATGFKIMILVMALITSAGNLFELFFLLGVRNRILNPVESLKRGVAEIMKGNYTVVVDPNTHSEVSDLIDAFNDMAHKLYEDEQLKEEYERNRKLLIANISHDLKTPITSVQGYVEAIVDQPDMTPDKLRKYLTIIHNNARYMNRLIDDLFLFTKLDMQKLDFDFAITEMRRYMADLMEEFRLELTENRVELQYADDLQNETHARIDPKRLHQVVRNIVDNAVKYGPAEGLRIAARLYAQGESLCLDLRDNGPGIQEDQMGRVFERFYRVDAERTKDMESTGLGLAIAKELIAAHGGNIDVAGGDGGGTRFTIALPIAEPGKEGKDEEHTDH